MGADPFINTISNYPDPAQAFDTLVREAQYDWGHAGYTGTIAEKPGFIVVDLPGLSAEQRRKFVAVIENFSPPYMKDEKWDGTKWVRIPEMTAKIAKARERAWVEAFKLSGLRRTPALQALAEKAYAIYDEKWGPALCVNVGRSTWTFCGWASS